MYSYIIYHYFLCRPPAKLPFLAIKMSYVNLLHNNINSDFVLVWRGDSDLSPVHMSQRTIKPTIRLVQPVKTHIRLRIRTVWSESSLIVCLLHPPGYPKIDKQKHLLYWVGVQADLSLCRFCRALAHILLRAIKTDSSEYSPKQPPYFFLRIRTDECEHSVDSDQFRHLTTIYTVCHLDQ